jgi:hypothetical protein
MIRSDRRIILYGVGSPLVIDAEESCVRARVEVIAGVRNMEGTVYVTSAVRVVTPVELTDVERACAVLCALPCPATGEPRSSTRSAPVSLAARPSSIRLRLLRSQPLWGRASSSMRGASSQADPRSLTGFLSIAANRSASIGHHARIGS